MREDVEIQGKELPLLTAALLEAQTPTAMLVTCLTQKSFLCLSDKRENRLLQEALDHVSSLSLSARSENEVSKLVFEIVIKCFVNIKL